MSESAEDINYWLFVGGLFFWMLLIILAIIRLVSVWDYIEEGKALLYLLLIVFFPYIGSIVILFTARKDPLIAQRRAREAQMLSKVKYR
jgi:hypothetical protein